MTKKIIIALASLVIGWASSGAGQGSTSAGHDKTKSSKPAAVSVLAYVPKKGAPALTKQSYFDYIAATKQEEAALPFHPTGPVIKVVTLLDTNGNLKRPVNVSDVAAWKTELGHVRIGRVTREREATLHIWMGEWELAKNEQPDKAIWHFHIAKKLTNGIDTNTSQVQLAGLNGLAGYDEAEALFFSCNYRASARDYMALLTSKHVTGFPRQTCSIWAREAGARAEYHRQRNVAGIPEPVRLDPYCAAAAIGTSLRSMGRRYDRGTVLKACRVTGEGSNLQDIIEAGVKLGVAVHVVDADDQGLIGLPKPLVAFVEHDHFISVVRADQNGVAYLCSDCGPWPGGEVDLTWKQWHMMEAAPYAILTNPGSPVDQCLSQSSQNADLRQADEIDSQSQVRVAMVGQPDLGSDVAKRLMLLIKMRHVILNAPRNTDTQHNRTRCGGKLPAKHKSPYKNSKTGGDPVVLSTGEEEYTAKPDLVVYNPGGPSIAWVRTYDSLRAAEETGYNCNDYGVGWTNNFNSCIYDPGQSYGPNTVPYHYGPGSVYVTLPNGSYVDASPGTWNSDHTAETMSVPSGTPLLVTYHFATTGYGSYSVTGSDGTVFTYQHISTPNDYSGIIVNNFQVGNYYEQNGYYVLTAVNDRYGNGISLNYSFSGPYFGSDPNASNIPSPQFSPGVALPGGGVVGWKFGPYLSSITGGGRTLLTINRFFPKIISNSSGQLVQPVWQDWEKVGNVTSISDYSGRSVYYHSGTYNNTGCSSPNPLYMQELDRVSVMTTQTSAGAVPNRYVYGYENGTNQDGAETVPFLHTVTSQSPTGATPTGVGEMRTLVYDYSPTTSATIKVTDPNGNYRTMSDDTSLTTTERVYDASQTLDYIHTLTYDTDMDDLSDTDGTNSNRLYTMTYDTVDPNEPSVVQDGNGKQWTYTWDVYGNVLTATRPLASSSITASVTMRYDYDYSQFPLGQLKSIRQVAAGQNVNTGPFLQGPTFDYDQNGGLWHVYYPDPDGAHNTDGTPVMRTITYNRDSNGQILSVVEPGSNGTTVTHTFDYYFGNLGEVHHVYNNDGYTVGTYGYDGNGNLTSYVDANGNETDTTPDPVTFQTTEIKYPSSVNSINVRSKTDYTYSYPGGPVSSVTDYAESGQIASQSFIQRGPASEVLGVIGTNGTTVRTTYDGMYRPATISNSNTGAVRTYTYGDPAGYLSQISDGRGCLDKFTSYDHCGRLATAFEGATAAASTGVETDYIYYDDGSLKQVTNPAGNVSVTYDNVWGQLQSVTDKVGTLAYGYNFNGYCNAVTRQFVNGPSGTLQYDVNPDGSRSSMEVIAANPSGTPTYDQKFGYGYDSNGRLHTITNPFTGTVPTATYNYNNDDSLQSVAYSNQLTNHYSYNALGLPYDISVTGFSNANGQQVDYAIGYDGNFNTNSVTATVPGGITRQNNYWYDGLSQLTRETSVETSPAQKQLAQNAFVYDGDGNATTFRGTTGIGYNAADGLSSVSYDGRGNPVTTTKATTSFDALDRMTSATVGAATVNYAYDANGLLGKKSVTGGATLYLVYDGGEPVVELDATGNVLATNTFGPSGLVSRNTPTTGNVFYTFDDHGNTELRTNDSRVILSSHVFDAYGKELPVDNTTNDPYAGFGAQYGYRREYGTGLYLLGHRFYDPATGRFVNQDPIGIAGGLDLYEYAGNNPIDGADPSGYDPITDYNNQWGVMNPTPIVHPVTNPDADSVNTGSQQDPNIFGALKGIDENGRDTSAINPDLNPDGAFEPTSKSGECAAEVESGEGSGYQPDGDAQIPNLRDIALDTHNAIKDRDPIRFRNSAVAIQAVRTSGGIEIRAATSSGRFAANQLDVLSNIDVNPVQQTYRKGDHAEDILRNNLQPGEQQIGLGISWGGRQLPLPCSVCGPKVNQLGGWIDFFGSNE